MVGLVLILVSFAMWTWLMIALTEWASYADPIATRMHWLWTAHEWWRWWARREVWIVVLLSLAVSPAAGCAMSAEERARTALDAVAVPVDAAWGLAEDVCLARQAPLKQKQLEGLATPEETKAALATVRASCQPTTDLFTTIRWAHEEAKQALRDGDVARAQALLEEILARWRELKERRRT